MKITTSKHEISVIVDDSMTFTSKSTLIIYIQVCLANYGME
jgi:hypothetical protein